MKLKISSGLFAAIFLVLIYLFWNNKLGGPSPLSAVDANPTSQDIEQWSVEHFQKEGWRIWNNNPSLDTYSRNFDSGEKRDGNLQFAPWGKDNWGLKAYGWGEGVGEKDVALSRLKAQDGKFYIKVRQEGGFYGNGTMIQGWNWGSCEDVPWHCPPPLIAGDKKIVLSLDLKIDSIDPGQWYSLTRWLMIGATFWFRSPDLPKPLVTDLGFYINRSIMFSHESASGYHYQKMVVANKTEAINCWRHYDIDLIWFINDAFRRFNIPESARKTLALQSVEMLVESKESGAAIEVGNFALYYK
ncbi:MAG: hypothetical protein A2750_00735 [Candidatus Yanofskybacteria bacterium RIFCSPHIGHO2_01_FULL_45_42]|uniref:Uncharacterized protein n=3 Tax=Candidatus Yanofskyibacteriota TaxID=1752733 RepID=A0A1F8H473_9BACT|nr:MAG: hypothetical protein A2750_00735 [Candidatus Yanofskybacteria bacterium RIFCSPHIGHO2_01_FULL_45_42]OGN16357.1 MAG: hypothetical protein A3C81_02755 [Candidatus Yanofskybacteria bacterium RIFCSPHIGHO2_02_FULL_46_19]OGN26985.1 MAG: hypothetical protein A3B17_03075 [Candidatus Yanofskybacteria bacterium RIFCSPLOWO2_01_FULL_45_72]OGN32392.1 MAG: hypothetical protein A3J01_00525 [Candidatus Yanofskybacteria bacterium RIFCSPLOWO2_02_FULL_45_18]